MPHDPPTPQPSLDDLMAWSMDADPELLPFLPQLFADLEELGARAVEVLEVLRGAELTPESRVLDLGCGKGAISVAIAAKFGCTVVGVDGLGAFVTHARQHAERTGVGGRCTFVEADVRQAVADLRDYDAVCMLALGDVLGPADEAVATLRECVRSGGFILIDDAFLRDGDAPPDELVNCFDHATTLALLTSSGDEIVSEIQSDGVESAEEYDRMTAAIARRAEELAQAHPAEAERLRGFAARQQAEVDLLNGPVVGALWLLRRA